MMDPTGMLVLRSSIDPSSLSGSPRAKLWAAVVRRFDHFSGDKSPLSVPVERGLRAQQHKGFHTVSRAFAVLCSALPLTEAGASFCRSHQRIN